MLKFLVFVSLNLFVHHKLFFFFPTQDWTTEFKGKLKPDIELCLTEDEIEDRLLKYVNFIIQPHEEFSSSPKGLTKMAFLKIPSFCEIL